MIKRLKELALMAVMVTLVTIQIGALTIPSAIAMMTENYYWFLLYFANVVTIPTLFVYGTWWIYRKERTDKQ